MSFGMQESGSQSNQGLMPEQRYYFGSMMPELFGQARTRADEAYADPGGLAFQPVVDQLLPIGPYGVPTSATEGVKQLGRDLFTGVSGSRAMRGWASPYNLEGVVGDSVRMASGQLVPLATQTAFTRAQMAPALRQAAFNFGVSPFEMVSRAVSGSGQSSSSGSGFMLDASAFGPAKGK